MEEFENLTFDPLDLQVRAAIMSIDKEKRTFDMVLATETPVRAFDQKNWEIVDQILTCTPEAADVRRLVGSGVGFFEIHPSLVYNTETAKRNQLGKIEAVRFENGKCIASVRMSTRPNDEHLQDVWHDIQDGIRTSVSIGFVPTQVTRIETEDGKRNQMIVDKWELMEGSLADVAAAPDTAIQRSATKPDDYQIPTNAVQVRSALHKATPPAPAPVAVPIDNRNTKKVMDKTPEEIAAIEARAIAAETELAKTKREAEVRSICAEINHIATRNGGAVLVDQAMQDQFVASDKPANEIRKETLRMFAALDPSKGASGGAKVGEDLDSGFTRRVENALLLTVNADFAKDMTPAEVTAAREFRGMSAVRLAEEFATRAGETSKDSKTIALTALGMNSRSGALVQADLPSVFENVLNKSIMREYTLRKPTYEEWTQKDDSIQDFKPVKKVSLGDMSPLQLAQDGDEYTYGTTTDRGESYRVYEYKKGFKIGAHTIINNELNNILRKVPAGFAMRVAHGRNSTAYSILLNNDDMSDGDPLFHANHGNLLTASALDNTNFKLAVQLMVAQKSLGTKNEPGINLMLMPKYLIVGPNLMFTAQTLMNPGTLTPATTADINEVKGYAKVIMDPLITGNKWFVVGDAAYCDTVEMGFLAGQTMGVRMRTDWDTDALDFHVSDVHGGAALDWKNMVYNPGV